MHPATALADVLVDEWIRCGGREAVLCPGSRSAPLAYALYAAERAGRIRLHVRVDERSAGFLALGLGKVSRRPALVVTTSGTAVANLHPAVLEAHHASVPLMVLSADRPAQLRGTGANQTTDQVGIFGSHVRFAVDLPAPHRGEGQVPAWRSTVGRGWAAATGAGGSPPWSGPVHLNVGFGDPLAPEPDGDGWVEPLGGRPGGAPWVGLPKVEWEAAVGKATSSDGAGGADIASDDPAHRTLVIVGDLPDPSQAPTVVRLAAERGYPVVTEPFGRSGGNRTAEADADHGGLVMPHGPAVLGVDSVWTDHAPTRVLVVGRPTLSRGVATALRRAESGGAAIESVTATPQWPDPGHRASRVHPVAALPELLPPQPDNEWARHWVSAGQRVSRALAPLIGADDRQQELGGGEGNGGAAGLTGPQVAHVVLSNLRADDLVVLGSSNTVRDVDYALGVGIDAVPAIVANRGLAGIDGTVATASGIAFSRGSRVTALMGDLTFLHDANGLLTGPDEQRADLDIIVVNDDGGGIFSTLEYGHPDQLRGGGAARFDRIFGTPTGANIGEICSGLGVSHYRVRTASGLDALLQHKPAPGPRVIEVQIDRGRHRQERDRLAAALGLAVRE